MGQLFSVFSNPKEVAKIITTVIVCKQCNENTTAVWTVCRTCAEKMVYSTDVSS